jgi:hypothetical protein
MKWSECRTLTTIRSGVRRSLTSYRTMSSKMCAIERGYVKESRMVPSLDSLSHLNQINPNTLFSRTGHQTKANLKCHVNPDDDRSRQSIRNWDLPVSFVRHSHVGHSVSGLEFPLDTKMSRVRAKNPVLYRQ